jgi:hypothetical protein
MYDVRFYLLKNIKIKYFYKSFKVKPKMHGHDYRSAIQFLDTNGYRLDSGISSRGVYRYLLSILDEQGIIPLPDLNPGEMYNDMYSIFTYGHKIHFLGSLPSTEEEKQKVIPFLADGKIDQPTLEALETLHTFISQIEEDSVLIMMNI